MASMLLSAALAYARMGLSVFPCKPDKTPYVKGGFHSATLDEQQIMKWWTEHPDAMIGMPTGPVSGVWALDIDMPKEEAGGSGYDSLQKLVTEYGDLPST